MTKIVAKRSAGMSDEQTENQIAVSEFAPRRDGVRLTAEMLQPNGNDPIRLTQVAGLAVEKIGVSTADQIELVAITIVENAKAGAQQILDDARIQADNMVSEAERLSVDMTALATNIRSYAIHKSEQLSAFCTVSETVMGTMHALSDQYVSTRRAEVEDFKRRQEEEPIDVPDFIRRPKQ